MSHQPYPSPERALHQVRRHLLERLAVEPTPDQLIGMPRHYSPAWWQEHEARRLAALDD